MTLATARLASKTQTRKTTFVPMLSMVRCSKFVTFFYKILDKFAVTGVTRRIKKKRPENGGIPPLRAIG